MSVLGQKATCASQNVTSAFPSRADMCSARGHAVMVEPFSQHRYGPRGPVSELQIFRTCLEILCVV
jgi:hypothetical protein